MIYYIMCMAALYDLIGQKTTHSIKLRWAGVLCVGSNLHKWLFLSVKQTYGLNPMKRVAKQPYYKHHLCSCVKRAPLPP